MDKKNFKPWLETVLDNHIRLGDVQWKNEVYHVVKIKCKETARETRYVAINTVLSYGDQIDPAVLNKIISEIQNIDNDKVIPKIP